MNRPNNINLINNSINKERMNAKLIELSRRLGEARRASTNIYDEVLQTFFIKGYYIKNYKTGYDIMKPILGDHIKYNISKRGRKSLLRDLDLYQADLTKQIKNINDKIKADKEREERANRRSRTIAGNRIRAMVRNRLSNLYIPISQVPNKAVQMALTNNINLNELFTITLQSAQNPDITLTKTFRNLDHLKIYINHSNEAVETDYGFQMFITDGVMDKVKIINLENIVGGCSRIEAKKHDKVYQNHIYRFNVVSQISKYNNCGIECLRHIIPFEGKADRIRKEFNIDRNTKLSFDQLNNIYLHKNTCDNKPLALITSQTTGIIDKNQFNYLFFDGDHYYNLVSVEEITPRRKVKHGSLYYDLETRLTENKIYIKSKLENGKTVIKTSRILKDVITAIYYKPYRSTEYQKHIFITDNTTSSVRQFADWLINQAQDNKFYRCVAHNSSRFDMYFFLASLTKQETLLSKINFRGTSIIGMNFFNHTFIDSCCHLLNSLDNLCQSYKVVTPKLKTFKYRDQDYTNEQLCFYKPNLSFNDFLKLQQTEPDFWELYTTYCMYDCISLCEVWTIYTDRTNDIINKMDPKLLLSCGANTSLTVGGLSIKIMKGLHADDMNFKKYKKFMNNDEEKYKFIKLFKRGGISHNNKCGRTEGVISVDITSQYPASMIYMDIPTGDSKWTKTYDSNEYGYYHLKNLVFVNGPSFKPIAETMESGVLNWNTGDFIENSYVDSFMIKYLFDNCNLISFDVEQALVSKEAVNGNLLFNKYVNTLFKEKDQQDILKGDLDIIHKKAKDKIMAQDLTDEIRKIKLEEVKQITNGYNPAYRETIKLFLNAVTGKFVENIDLYDDNIYTINAMDNNDKTNKSINDNYTQKEPKTKKQLNEYMGCGVMIYSYSKRLLFEYINLLPNQSEDVIHIETDSIYFKRTQGDKFKNNMKKYSGKYPVKLGKELGNVKIEKDEIGMCHFLGKKFYQIGDTFRIKGIPMKTITEDGSFINIVSQSIFERVYAGENIRVEYTTLKKNLYGKTYVSSHECHRTINSHPTRYTEF